MPERMHVTSKRGANTFLPHNQQDFNEVQHAPSANEHRRKRAGFDAVVAELTKT